MNTERLIQMANSIGEFFAAWPDQDEARRDLAAHIQRYWEPRMRRGIHDHIERAHGEGLSALVVQALRQHGAGLS
jgi:formate dehydrogenase subunit delta